MIHRRLLFSYLLHRLRPLRVKVHFVSITTDIFFLTMRGVFIIIFCRLYIPYTRIPALIGSRSRISFLCLTPYTHNICIQCRFVFQISFDFQKQWPFIKFSKNNTWFMLCWRSFLRTFSRQIFNKIVRYHVGCSNC